MSRAPGAPLSGRDRILTAARKHEQSKAPQLPPAPVEPDFSDAEYLAVLPAGVIPQIVYDPRCKVPRKSRQLTLQKLVAGHLRVEGVGHCRAQRMQHLRAPGVWKACLQNASSQESALLARASTRAVYVNAAARIKAADWQQSGPTSAAAATTVSNGAGPTTGGADSAGSGQVQPSNGTGTVKDAGTEGSYDVKWGTNVAVGHGSCVSTVDDVQLGSGGEGNNASQTAVEKSNASRQPDVRDAAGGARLSGDAVLEVAKPGPSLVVRRIDSADRSGIGSAASTIKDAITLEPPEADARHDAVREGGSALSKSRLESQSSVSQPAERITERSAAFVPPSIQQLQDIVLSAASISGGDRIHQNSKVPAADMNDGFPKRGLLGDDQGVPDSRQHKTQRTDAGPL